MSHFTVLVIGNDPEAQLAPYDENISVEPYKMYVDASTTEWPRSSAAGVDGTDDHAVAACLNAKWGEKTYHVDDIGLFEWSTYNPKSQWDWYSLGGRWTGHFLLRPGSTGATGRMGLGDIPAKRGWVDAARKDAIDFDGMRLHAAAEAGRQYDRYAALAAIHPPALDWEDVGGDTVEERRSIYWAQPLISALSKANLLPWSGGGVSETYGMGREAFVEKASRHAPTTYAMVAEGVWKGKGKVGWFGMSSEDGDPADWVHFWWKMVDGLPGDTLLSLYDCHI